MEEVKYEISSVTGRLSAKIANLEVQLAHTQAANEAYAARVQELEQQLKDVDMVEKEKSAKSNM